jgi:methylated-DNA-[protein]-cysteine S-methyltransferase
MSNQIQIQYFKTPFGEMILGAFDNQLCLADWRYRKMRSAVDQRLQKGLQASYLEVDTATLQETRNQLNAYFAAERQEFDLPLFFVGTDFQQKVWNALLKVPFGETATYLQLAEKHGDVKAIRAVASANGANAISIIVPCHRIIGSSGELVGYAGGLPAKQKLLALERAQRPQAVGGQLHLEF